MSEHADAFSSEPQPTGRPKQSFHKAIRSHSKIPYTMSGHNIELECGHRVMVFGNIANLGGIVLCTACRDDPEGS